MTTILAPAKLTLSLRVVGTRPDGFHLIEAEMVTLDLVDELTFGEGNDLRISVEGPALGGLAVTNDPNNLITRALAMVECSASVDLVKRIPAGGGLGGGSADAAAVFRWAGRTTNEDIVAASRLGADVSFCIQGGRALVTGIGEIITPLPYLPATFTLLTPPFGVSTPAVYRMWDALGGPADDGPNDLTAAAVAVEPRLAFWRDQLGDATGETPILAGSGSTWFVRGSYPGERRVVVQTTP